MTNFRAVLFDWRGTLALTLSGPHWIQEGFAALGAGCIWSPPYLGSRH
jgi:hypothetical protein